MKKIFLTMATAFALLHPTFGQIAQRQESTGYKSRKLKLDEVNLVSSYYSQDGNNAAVTGGIGSQKLSDIANIFDIRLTKYDLKERKHTFGLDVGIDHYSSASSDKIDLQANSSASHADTRVYPSLSWSVENEKKGTTLALGLSSSTEYDYQSFGGNIAFSTKTKDRNGEFTAKFQTYLDQVKLILPIELRSSGGEHETGGTAGRNTFAGSLSYAQVINQRFQVMLLADVVQQTGYLSLPFHRVYFKDGSVHQENLPNNRFKIPLGLRASYFLGDNVVIRTYYRFYTDNWGINAHTAEMELPVKINAFFSISPFYRYYTQTAAKYFAPYQSHTIADQYYNSNYDLSKFNSNFYGAGIRFAPPKGILGLQRLSMLEVRYGHYSKNIQMSSDIISLNIKYK
ncbi:DUF3570 domain-containing protein [Pedobacter chitinilyticus]|uniref:DUF3570 domain-containing protein n=1 Tax=Pedobacter chitinilyticus TaxID=2233776 RepID=A0A451GDG3_9SPHI|nr:DUF3570 domain-containing protein [Pedobacter chitinilyticus]RWU10912.1 DUF3570 domain-containing protein [Pedobacter chitinilyticus]